MIQCTDLVKTFHIRKRGLLTGGTSDTTISALQGVSFTVQEGEIVGILGPNGAGKTTLLRALSTLIVPDSGDLVVSGYSVMTQAQAVRRNIGVVFASDRSLYWKLTGMENLLVQAGLYNVPKRLARARAENLLRQADLLGAANLSVEKYSTGMRKRLMIARSLVHRPKVLIMDEPSAGLDVVGRRALWEVLIHLSSSEGVTTLLATHDMEEASVVPHRLLLIHQGKLYANGTARELMQSAHCETVVRVIVSDPKPDALASFIPVTDGFMREFRTNSPDYDLPRILERMSSVVRVERRDPNLADAFLRLTGADLKEDVTV